MTDWKEMVFKGVIMILAALITGVLVPWIKEKIGEIKLQKIITWSQIGVDAAEELFLGKKTGEAKRECVMALLDKFTQKLGLDLTDDELRLLLEAAVGNLHRKEGKDDK